MRSDNYKLCCSVILPDNFNHVGCPAPTDELSSCTALLQSNVYRIILAFLACVILVGNSTSLIFRTFTSRHTASTFGIYVSSLCAADWLMGLYLAIIGAADYALMGSYVWQDNAWKDSYICHIAGFLSLVSSEVSAFTICLITLDRFLVIRFPLKFDWHFSCRAARISSILSWLLGLVIAIIPVFLHSSTTGVHLTNA